MCCCLHVTCKLSYARAPLRGRLCHAKPRAALTCCAWFASLCAAGSCALRDVLALLSFVSVMALLPHHGDLAPPCDVAASLCDVSPLLSCFCMIVRCLSFYVMVLCAPLSCLPTMARCVSSASVCGVSVQHCEGLVHCSHLHVMALPPLHASCSVGYPHALLRLMPCLAPRNASPCSAR